MWLRSQHISSPQLIIGEQHYGSNTPNYPFTEDWKEKLEWDISKWFKTTEIQEEYLHFSCWGKNHMHITVGGWVFFSQLSQQTVRSHLIIFINKNINHNKLERKPSFPSNLQSPQPWNLKVPHCNKPQPPHYHKISLKIKPFSHLDTENNQIQ